MGPDSTGGVAGPTAARGVDRLYLRRPPPPPRDAPPLRTAPPLWTPEGRDTLPVLRDALPLAEAERSRLGCLEPLKALLVLPSLDRVEVVEDRTGAAGVVREAPGLGLVAVLGRVAVLERVDAVGRAVGLVPGRVDAPEVLPVTVEGELALVAAARSKPRA